MQSYSDNVRLSTPKVVYLIAILTFSSLYAAQPIQPVFQVEFNLSGLQAILFTTLIMAPLGVAPLLYGVLLESYCAKKLLRTAVIIMGVLEICFSFSESYHVLLILRGAQGLVIPAILTSLVSYISYSSPGKTVQRDIAFYVGATIFGGFLGRFLSGLITDHFGWRVFFFLLGGCFLLIIPLLGKVQGDIKTHYSKPNLREMASLLNQKGVKWLYLSIFFVFFAFAAMMNFLPFELKRISPAYGETGIGLIYIGYGMGVLVSLGNTHIRRIFSHEISAIQAGLFIYLLGGIFFFQNSYWVMFGAMFVFCTGMFMAHSLMSGYVNRLTSENKAVANGMYISFYYTGGTLGSFFPGFILDFYGWNCFVWSVLAVISISIVCVSRLKKSV